MAEIQVTTHRHAELSDVHAAVWREMQVADERIAGPYLHPEFTASVAAVRSDVNVAVLHRDGEYVGFLPFERTTLGAARPVGGRLNDYHGLVARPGLDVSLPEVIAGCGLKSWSFTNGLVEQPAFEGCAQSTEPAPFIDLCEGYDGFVEERRQSGSNRVKRIGKKSRQLAREVGELRYEHGIVDPTVLETLIAWKSEQYRRTGLADVFAHGWTTALLKRIHGIRRPDFSGRLSTLHAGDRLVAIEFGMQTDTVYHSWFPAYDPDFSKYSPGGVLLLDILRTGAEAGIRRVDLGAGVDNGKGSFASGTVLLGRGTVHADPISRFLHGTANVAKWIVKATPLRRVVRPIREWMEFR